MTLEEFRSTHRTASSATGTLAALRAMWEDAKGNWNGAHAIAQEIEDQTGSWIHAYLHERKATRECGLLVPTRRPADGARYARRRVGHGS